MIKREKYLNELIDSMNYKMPKVITRIKRCGKSFLLKEIFFEYLVNEKKVSAENIMTIELDDINNIQYRNPIKLSNYIREKIKNEQTYYVFIDEEFFLERTLLSIVNCAFLIFYHYIVCAFLIALANSSMPSSFNADIG